MKHIQQTLKISFATQCLLSISLGFAMLPAHAQDTEKKLGPVIDDETGQLDATIVSAASAITPEVVIPAREAIAAPPVEVEILDTLDPDLSTGVNPNFILPGSSYLVTTQDIRDQNYTNINRILARVPGVYVREEDGSGLFPNISIRGVDGTRNEKITVLEDGILQAPAPYAAPSAYYSPNVGRMAGVEIIKGPGLIGYGPNTTGGAINYLSTPIPEQEEFFLRTTYGSNATAQVHSYYGDTLETSVGKVGYLAEIYYKRSDGFRTVDGAPAFGIPSSNQTGYKVLEPMIKLFWEPDTALNQRIEFKYGYTSFQADETYLGLTDGDLAANPYRRYAGSYLDNMDTKQHRMYLKHNIEVTDDLDIQVAGYYNQFERDWFKIRQVNGSALHRTLGPTGTPADLATLQGRAPGILGYRHNARKYESYGVQFSGEYRLETGPLDHTFSFGLREHKDNVRRFQENTNVIIGGAAPIINDLGPGTGGNRFQESNATAIWLQDSIEIGRLTLTPGVRHERVKQYSTDYASDATNTPTAIRNGEIDWWVTGLSANFDFDDENSAFAGVHEGVAVPSPRSVLASGVGLEMSTNYELGFRHRSGNLNAELVGFYTDFENIIGTAAGLGQAATQNAGTGSIKGVEALVSYDPWQGNAVRLPMYLSTTWTDSTIDQSLAGGSEGIYGDGNGGPGIPGANTPYIPEWKVAVGIGVETDDWGLDLATTYVSDSFGTALNSPVSIDSARQGLIDGGVIVDLAAYYQINNRVKLIGGIQNLFEEVMITSRIPEGPRVNGPRQFYVGLEVLWGSNNSISASK